MRPFQPNLLPGIWRWWYEFGCGDMGNDGVHNLDIGVWGLGVETHPTSVAALGGKYFFDDDQQFPDTQYVAFEYPGDGKVGHLKQLVFEQRIWSPYRQEGYENGNAFYGTKGFLIMGHTVGWQLFGEKGKPIDSMTGTPNLPAHHRNFFDCIKSGNRSSIGVAVPSGQHRDPAATHAHFRSTAGTIRRRPRGQRPGAPAIPRALGNAEGSLSRRVPGHSCCVLREPHD
jgi:predicted dehydrogenase